MMMTSQIFCPRIQKHTQIVLHCHWQNESRDKDKDRIMGKKRRIRGRGRSGRAVTQRQGLP